MELENFQERCHILIYLIHTHLNVKVRLNFVLKSNQLVVTSFSQFDSIFWFIVVFQFLLYRTSCNKHMNSNKHMSPFASKQELHRQ